VKLSAPSLYPQNRAAYPGSRGYLDATLQIPGKAGLEGRDIQRWYEAVCDEWRISSSGLIRFTAHLKGNEAFSRILTVVTRKGDILKDSVGAALQHVFNHDYSKN
jgi:hypothetical protein